MNIIGRFTAGVASAILCSFVLSGCGSTTPPADVSAACVTVDKSTTPPTCTQLYDSGEALRLPAQPDSKVGAVTRAGSAFVTSAGTRLELNDDARNIVTVDNAYANTVYQANVEGGMVTAVTPVLTIPTRLVLGRVLGGAVLVGSITPYAGDDTYDLDSSLPVVVSLDTSAAADGRLPGKVANAQTNIALTDGTCIPALSAAGTRNPLQGGFTSSVQVSRHPAMHTEFDDELVLEWSDSSSGMGAGFFPSLATLMNVDAMDPTWEITQHGTPSSGPALVLQRSPAAIDTSRTC